MTKLLVGVVVLVSAAGMAACGNGNKSKAKTSVPQTAGVLPDKPADVRFGAASAPSPIGGSQPGTVEPGPSPRFTLVLGKGKSGFKFRSSSLSDEAKAEIDAMFAGGKVDPAKSHFEIEGYTDNLGSNEVNHQIGLARAEAVKQYIGEQYEIPADCLHVVSYGMENPVADNSTPEGRAKNRRVVIKVVD